MPSRSQVEVRIKHPSDASSILVWDSTARPAPRWITVEAAGRPANLSFADHAHLRDFARAQQLPFSTEDERLEALQQLGKHWQMLAAQRPVRETRSASAPGEHDLDLTAGSRTQIQGVPLAPETLRRSRKTSKPPLANAKQAKTRKAAEAARPAAMRTRSVKRKQAKE